ncbi:RNA polymerase sigma factor [Paucibacter sp. O1-1]|uniref:RNA polymerase sigma factor n=1 Tax=Paucibacter sp. M5-1 TaxID=3015998 RepID=UPI0021D4D8BC|nr:RNA polymerase sigma factor [Paucibacter sp. M5-1]MCU7373130.1 RNA polymerase sigma factor [Paucibacter sp. O1-1]MCU7373217.1 RNA polymerase sigma factor [Paucibacter sp. O1-1]MCZ7879513.1 RNA polymerase sigma factor [Paucibacter sp. M5-1]MDA3828129.1 RNA polymerase sigma factor [Paucibacter sp. O1-1]MDA3828216.1 RNA polymerase sigma factor [Paucibacter sp. O1-1]
MSTLWPPIFAKIRTTLMRRGRSSDEADDLVQEAWVRLACYEREREAVADPEPFMMRIALNLSIDAHRMQAHHGEEVLAEEVVLADTAPSVEAVVLGRERMDRMNVCLGRMNDKTRDIFLAHRIEGLTYQEIAQHHGLSLSTIEKYIARATLLVATGMDGW